MARRKSDPIEDNLAKTKTVRGVGDNSGDKPIEGKKLLAFVEDLEKIQSKVDQHMQDKREVFAEAKAVGFDNKTIRKILKERKLEPEERKEAADLLDLYRSALGMLDEE